MGLGPSILASSKSVRISAGDETSAPLKSSAVYEGQRSVRFATSAVVNEGLHEDGYRWRKYGQKIRKGSPFPKSYFRCTYPNCGAKKQLEIVVTDGKKVTSSTYRGQHTHDAPQLTRLSAHDQSSFKRSVAIENQKAPFGSGLSFARPLIVPDPNRQQSRLVVEADETVDAMDDGYTWRKYGQKIVKGTPFPRSYYRCTYPGCNVKKQVRRMASQVVNSYEGVHTHPAPHGNEAKRQKLSHTPAVEPDEPPQMSQRPPSASRKIEIPDNIVALGPVVPLTPTSRGSNTPRSFNTPRGSIDMQDQDLSFLGTDQLTFSDMSRQTPHELQLFIPTFDQPPTSAQGSEMLSGLGLTSPHYGSATSPLGQMSAFSHFGGSAPDDGPAYSAPMGSALGSAPWLATGEEQRGP